MDLLKTLPLIYAFSKIFSTIPICSSANCPWPPLYLYKRSPLKRMFLSYSELNTMHQYMKDGYYKPNNCTAKQKIAIIVPFRDRELQLKVFLLNALSKAYRQQLEFGVYLIEQMEGTTFNKGALLNIGIHQANKDQKYDCFILHDVDIIPEDDRNYYMCGDNPRHIAYIVEQFGYRPGPEEYFGGIVAFTLDQLTSINGFSNLYKGWGLEDDDSYRRILSANLTVERPQYEIANCGSIKHRSPSKCNDRCEVYTRYARMWQYDGLNSIQYSIMRKEFNQLFRRIVVSFDTDAFRKNIQQQMESVDASSLPPRILRPQNKICKKISNGWQKYCRTIKDKRINTR